MSDRGLAVRPGEPVARAALPVLEPRAWRDAIVADVAAGGRLLALFGAGEAAAPTLHAIHQDRAGQLRWSLAPVRGSWPSLTSECPQAHLFEREIWEASGAVPEGHPWLKPVRRAPGTAASDGAPPFFAVAGDDVHEVAVGPVHAGVIEPGHFRFQCHGEAVFHLEIALGYQHRGVEALLAQGPDRRTLHVVETLAGDTTLGHATTACEALEALLGVSVPPRGHALRALGLELERLANHVGDLGALANDVGFLPTAAYCGRLRGDFLNLTAALCGNRFGRSLVRVGGTGFDVDPERAAAMRDRLAAAARDVRDAVALLFGAPIVRARFEGTGVVTAPAALDLGLVGMAARACGLPRDVRHEFPPLAYRAGRPPLVVLEGGDVMARARLRAEEIERSVGFVDGLLAALPAGPARAAAAWPAPLAPGHAVFGLGEGWRGELVHVLLTDAAGRIERWKVVDPSFHNWSALAMALRGEEISDFPLCNKSFNLSYCGFDL
ncbi:MAG: NADH-quinone oxidoreductase subunit C [Planctomycetes bacterium]|nr:NADH-quinone oxidoreductase subunit C [Planctomycetota bacterium]